MVPPIKPPQKKSAVQAPKPLKYAKLTISTYFNIKHKRAGKPKRKSNAVDEVIVALQRKKRRAPVPKPKPLSTAPKHPSRDPTAPKLPPPIFEKSETDQNQLEQRRSERETREGCEKLACKKRHHIG